jgi:membrane protein implicated in regulation of membrane protease activity
LSANRELIGIPNIIFIITGLYFAIVAAIGEGSVYIALGAVLCFVSVGLILEKDWFFSWPWRLATAAFSIVVLLAQLGADFTVSNPSAVVVASILVNGILFILLVGVFLWNAKDLTTREEEEEEEEEEEPERKKKLTYEI